ncbi:MAG TPA: ABC transporter permease subunit [Candidatus Mcinerneyibacterium sp.]|nr:ABC transporter permease subunit [Candidatus Mcinerneyibacterium sp.]
MVDSIFVTSSSLYNYILENINSYFLNNLINFFKGNIALYVIYPLLIIAGLILLIQYKREKIAKAIFVVAGVAIVWNIGFFGYLESLLESIPKIPLGNWIESFVNFLIDNFQGPFESFSNLIESMIDSFESMLKLFHPMILMLIISGLTYWKRKKIGLSIFVIIGLGILWNLNLWPELITTLASIITSVIVALVIGIPVGILKAHSKILHHLTRPILDFMQTIPPFVYLIPALMFFGLGTVSGVIATVVFAIAPPIRLTYLGIIQIPEEMKEAGRAYGANPLQMLYKIEIPGALPSIMMGINQCIMLALSMVVIAAMIGAGGLGKIVLRSLSVVDIGMGFEAGIGIVIIAIILDRLFDND